MPKINARRKGKTGELFIAKFLRSCGIPAKRGQQFKGTKDSPDVVCQENYQVEVKNKKTLQLNSVWAKLLKEAEGKIPLLFYKGVSKQEWKVILSLSHFKKLLVTRTVVQKQIDISQILEYQEAIESSISIISTQINILKRKGHKVALTEKETESLRNLVNAQKTCLDLIKKYKEEIMSVDASKLKSIIKETAKNIKTDEEGLKKLPGKAPIRTFKNSDF